MRSWTIPAVLLAALLAFAASSVASANIVLPRGSVWKYDDTGTNLGTAWKDPGFDDSLWSSGPAVLGYGETYIVTPTSYGPDSTMKYTTTYFRATFDLQDPPDSLKALFLNANYDDGAVIYINGTEVARPSMPLGPIVFGTFAAPHEGGGYAPINITSALPLLTPTGNVIAVEVHQTSLTSSDLVMDFEVETSTASAIVTRGPYLQMGRPDAMLIRWRTDVSTDSRVWYGTDPGNLTQTVDNAAVGQDHEVTVTGLQPDTRYYYAVGIAGADEQLEGADADHHFETSLPTGATDPIRIWAIGDSGQPGAGQDNTRDAYLAYPGADRTDLWMMLGDNAYNTGLESEYDAAVFNAYPSLLRTVPLWPTRGNHDVVRGGLNNDYYDFFNLPAAGEAGGVVSGTEAYYSFNFGNIHFVCLDSEGTSLLPGGAMLTWLAQDLAANTADWTIAFWHHPPYTKGSHDSDNAFDSGGRMRDMRQNALPILDQYGADLVLCGHSHSYERSFLLDGHYGLSTSLTGAMILDGGDGDPAGDGAYTKATLGPAANEGAVYLTAGNGSKISGGALNHPAMLTSLNLIGSLVIDVAGARMDLTFLDSGGAVQDHFTIVKGAATSVVTQAPAGPALAVAAQPSPFTAATTVAFALPADGRARLRVMDAGGRVIRTLLDEPRAAGSHRVSWDGRDGAGRALPSGVYFLTVEAGGELRASKVVRTR